ncbi:MAG: acyl-CoA desaturase [Legionellaceae bacterium]|nr:acyl-CoA desaturase [Legionellaceae bacterium]
MKSLKNSLSSWFVNENNYNPDAADGDDIDWLRVVPFLLLNLSCLLVFWVNWSATAIYTALGLYVFRIFTIGAFYHRYFSHKTFKTNRFWQFIFAALAGTAVQRGPLWWASHHRQHHMCSDSPDDAHSPKQHGFWHSHIGWFLTKKNFNYNPERVKDLAKFPELVFLERYDALMPSLLFLSLLSSGWYLQVYRPDLHTGIAEMLVWGFSVSLVAVFNTTVIINSLCHVYGTKRYATKDNSKNNLLFAILTLGEGWHNNHHHYSNSARQGFRWWEIDITFYIINLLELLGIVWDVKPVPKSVLENDLYDSANDKK